MRGVDVKTSDGLVALHEMTRRPMCSKHAPLILLWLLFCCCVVDHGWNNVRVLGDAMSRS